MVNLQRIEKLIDGSLLPEELGEELFLKAYTEALSGTILIHVMIQIADILDHMSIDDLHMFNLGYAMGQRDLEDAQAAMTDKIIGGNDTTH